MNSTFTVLIADDDILSRMMLERLVVKWGLNYLSASNGEAAREMLKCHDVHACIFDWDMPILSGLELCRWLKSVRQAHSPYVLINTARNSVEDLQRAFEAGADDFLVKPTDYEYLHRQLKRLSERTEYRPMKSEESAHASLADPYSSLFISALLTR